MEPVRPPCALERFDPSGATTNVTLAVIGRAVFVLLPTAMAGGVLYRATT
ncbi:MAG TPA: hypothetical protein VGF51_17500 [Acidimicrobiales bacterium]